MRFFYFSEAWRSFRHHGGLATTAILALTAALIGFVTGSFFLSLAYHDILYTLLAFTLALAKIAHHADAPSGPRPRRVPI